MSILNDKEITSVQDGNTNQFPAKVDAPPPPQAEQERHTGAKNVIDPQIYQQNVKIRSLNWSVTDERGKVLAIIPVSPKNMGPYVEYLQPMYHYWSGGVMVSLRAMGTAYQAGQFVMVEVPPEVDAEQVALTGDYTGYNWVAIDVKDPALISMHVRDVNQGAFHYTSPINTFGPLNIGSQLLIVVDSPLNSTTGGTQQVGIEVWAKPSSEFRFSRLRIPRITNVPSVSAPAEIEFALDFTRHGFDDIQCNSIYPIDKITVLPATFKSVKLCNTGVYDLEGKVFVRDKLRYNEVKLSKQTPFNESTQRFEMTISGINTVCIPRNAYSDQAMVHAGSGGILYALGVTMKANSGATCVVEGIAKNIDIYNGIFNSTPILLMPYRTASSDIQPWDDDTGVFTLTTNESFVVFTATNTSNLHSHQTDELARVFSSKKAAGWIPAGSCATFMMIDAIENIPIGTVKLWSEGFFTTRASTDFVKFASKNISFVFKGFVPRTQVLKVEPELAVNRMLVANAHKKLFARHESRTQKQ